MNATSRVTLRWPLLIAGALVCLALGAGLAYVVLRPAPATPGNLPSGAASASSSQPATAAPQMAPANVPSPEVSVTLTPEAIQRAGIVVTPVSSGSGSTQLRLPGVVEPNAYRQVVVTPVASGRVTRVLVELGQRVRRGQALAEIFSPELAEVETRYVSSRAELDAHERELMRTEKLVEIGAASRQELERLHAEHTAKLTAVEGAKSRLELLGLSASTIASLGLGKDLGAVTTVPAPIDGVVTERAANPGLNVDTSARLFTVVDLSTVWVVANIYERDFFHVRVGTQAKVTTTAFPDLVLSGRVSYIDPQVHPEMRTARVRVEVPNSRQELRLGMFADVSIETGGRASTTQVPRAAVQHVGDRTIVYIADPKQPGRFVEREVRLGAGTGHDAVVLSGVQAGDSIVTDGSFSVRAERDRLGITPSAASRPTTAIVPTSAPSAERQSNVQEAKVLVTEQGYEPAKLTVRAGMPVRLTFVRTTDKTCGTEVVFPSLSIRRPLPLNQPVAIEFTPKTAGEIGFVCGTNMFRGTLVVE
jgi:RND family efflux transporter MFP subunit